MKPIMHPPPLRQEGSMCNNPKEILSIVPAEDTRL